MAAAGAVISLIGGAVGAIGAVQRGRAEVEAANYNAEVQEYNAHVATRNAGMALAQAGAEAKDRQRQSRRQLATIRTAYGGSGFDLSGTALDVLADSAYEAEYDVSKIRYQGEIRAMGYRQQAENYLADAELSRKSGKAIKSAIPFSVAGHLLGGAAGAINALNQG